MDVRRLTNHAAKKRIARTNDAARARRAASDEAEAQAEAAGSPVADPALKNIKLVAEGDNPGLDGILATGRGLENVEVENVRRGVVVPEGAHVEARQLRTRECEEGLHNEGDFHGPDSVFE